ncbi:nucleotidyltransferase [Silvibacterium acidisoli]|uniref:nucleotidyltransferase n=1 Tax=Acidobacteriaceae bacterium ZG23-2 TaxID=2883246 RepID=UPI00406CABE0
MFPDFRELLASFNANGVRYLIIGGYAVSFHAQPRATKDLDIWVKADPANATATYQALSDFGAPLASISTDDLANPKKFIRFGREPIAIDILPNIDGIDFEEAWPRRVEAQIAPGNDLKAYFISREDLITAKLAAGRLRDLADVEELREAEQAESNILPKKDIP